MNRAGCRISFWTTICLLPLEIARLLQSLSPHLAGAHDEFPRSRRYFATQRASSGLFLFADPVSLWGSFKVRPLHAWRSDTIGDAHAQTRQQQPAWQR